MRPTHWWNPKYPTMPNQLTAPNEGGGWEASYSADQLREALEETATSARAAPSSEEVREMVERLRGEPNAGDCDVLMDRAADMIERLAARVPTAGEVKP
jgi:hypothetical protein